MIIPAHAQVILNQETALLKLDRIAFQILEKTYKCNDIVMIGILDGGFCIAEKLSKIIEIHQPEKNIQLVSMFINKQEPLKAEILLHGIDNLNDKTIVLVDDVANTGKTMFYAFKKLVEYNIQQLITCVLIDRTHKKFPIQSDIVGLQMATTYNEHIIVKFNHHEIENAYLF
jgi:pyrimidine operon attenuation protein/uracil phosphoribosyltransferase